MSPVELYLTEGSESDVSPGRGFVWGLLAVFALCIAFWIAIALLVIHLI